MNKVVRKRNKKYTFVKFQNIYKDFKNNYQNIQKQKIEFNLISRWLNQLII
jgi:hypothetical protein